MTTASGSNREKNAELPGWVQKTGIKPDSCLAKVSGQEGHKCGGFNCVKTLARQHKQLTILFVNIVMKTRNKTELIADCHGGIEVNVMTALGLYSMFGSLESLLNREQKHEMITVISLEVFRGLYRLNRSISGSGEKR